MKRKGSCSKMSLERPVILVDLDNVVYDWTRQMIDWLNRNNALPAGMHPDIAYSSYSQWGLWNDWGIPEGEFFRWWRLGIEEGEIYAKGELIPGARTALWQLSDAEWDIHIATSRLTKFGLHDRIILNTASWLRDNNIPYRNCHFTDDKTAIRADAIIDDRADNMDREAHKEIYLFPANHNSDHTVSRAEQRKSWEVIASMLTTKVRLPENA